MGSTANMIRARCSGTGTKVATALSRSRNLAGGLLERQPGLQLAALEPVAPERAHGDIQEGQSGI